MSGLKGVILAGGQGTRLGLSYNKQAHNVGGRRMIEYPLESLKLMGVDEPIIVTSPQGLEDLKGVDAEFRVQPEPKGMADALGYAGRIAGVFPVLCGDVYFDPAPPTMKVPSLIFHQFEGANNHTVWNPETNEIVEKPTRYMGNRAIVAYWFNEEVFDMLNTIEPSVRGELEFTGIYQRYRQQGAPMVKYEGFYCDMGTPEGIARVEAHICESVS